MKTKHQTVQVLTAGQMKELISAVAEGIPSNLSQENAQYWIGNKRKLAKEIRKVLVGQEENQHLDLIQCWQHFWHKITGQEYDFSTLRIPTKPEGNWRLLVIADILLETLYVECQKRFPCWRWTGRNLDQIVTKNERSAKDSSYAIWVKDEVEADENLKNLSANGIKSQNLTTETLAERLIHELKFFDETSQHLDVKNITLCAGSRDDDGSVPDVYWNQSSGEVSVDWDHPDGRDGNLRARQAVSV